MSGRQQLEKAVNAFNAAMKEKLLQKYDAGYRGWNHKRFIK